MEFEEGAIKVESVIALLFYGWGEPRACSAPSERPPGAEVSRRDQVGDIVAE